MLDKNETKAKSPHCYTCGHPGSKRAHIKYAWEYKGCMLKPVGFKYGPHISWEIPKVEMLVEYLTYHLLWEPSHTRQRLLPMLSTIFLREMASNPTNDLLYGNYEFDAIRRVKIRFGHQYYMVNWKNYARSMDTSNTIYKALSDKPEPEPLREMEESIDMLDEPDVTVVYDDNGCFFLLTDGMELVRAAFTEKVKSIDSCEKRN